MALGCITFLSFGERMDLLLASGGKEKTRPLNTVLANPDSAAVLKRRFQSKKTWGREGKKVTDLKKLRVGRKVSLRTEAAMKKTQAKGTRDGVTHVSNAQLEGKRGRQKWKASVKNGEERREQLHGGKIGLTFFLGGRGQGDEKSFSSDVRKKKPQSRRFCATRKFRNQCQKRGRLRDG